MEILIHPTPPAADSEFAERLRTAVRRSGLSLDRLATRLAERGHRISRTTLSNWQRGQTVPARPGSLAALPDLERLLGVERGALTASQDQEVEPDEGGYRLEVSVAVEERRLLRAMLRHETEMMLRVRLRTVPSQRVQQGQVRNRHEP